MSRKSLFDLTGRSALVTGGAQGLGKGMAEALADFGASILIMDLNADLARQTAEELASRGARCLATRGDVTSPADAAAAVELAVREFGRLDVLVNNAGIVRNTPAEVMSLEEWSAVISVNLTGAFICAQAAGRQMIKQGDGRIVNIASMSGLIVNNPQPQVAYNASKAGVIMLTKSLAAEWAQHAIRVNAIAPGYMRTSLTAKFFEKPDDYASWYAPRSPDDTVAAMVDRRRRAGVADTEMDWLLQTPLKRPGEPEDLAGGVVYLASDASRFVTGHVLVIDGGYTVW